MFFTNDLSQNCFPNHTQMISFYPSTKHTQNIKIFFYSNLYSNYDFFVFKIKISKLGIIFQKKKKIVEFTFEKNPKSFVKEQHNFWKEIH
jgi:hypothetical protein